MANFATKSIDSPTRQRLQRLADSLPNLKGTVTQKAPGKGVTTTRYTFTGEVRKARYDGLLLGVDYVSAKKALEGLSR